MAEYDNANKGALFKNDRRDRDSQPTHTGSINVDGKEYWINAWVKESKKDGSRFFSLSVTPKDAPKDKGRKSEMYDKDLDDSDIPF